jgi:hypothetical protein
VAVRRLGGHRRRRRRALRAAGRHHQPRRVRADQFNRSGDLGWRSAAAARSTARVAGALLVNYAKTYFTGALPEVWLYALGALFILVTLLLPRGLVGLRPGSWFAGRRLGVRTA